MAPAAIASNPAARLVPRPMRGRDGTDSVGDSGRGPGPGAMGGGRLPGVHHEPRQDGEEHRDGQKDLEPPLLHEMLDEGPTLPTCGSHGGRQEAPAS